jgi:hypothetical protein
MSARSSRQSALVTYDIGLVAVRPKNDCRGGLPRPFSRKEARIGGERWYGMGTG